MLYFSTAPLLPKQTVNMRKAAFPHIALSSLRIIVGARSLNLSDFSFHSPKFYEHEKTRIKISSNLSFAFLFEQPLLTVYEVKSK